MSSIASRDDGEITLILRVDFGTVRIEKWKDSTCIEKRTYTPSELVAAGVDKLLLENKHLGSFNIITAGETKMNSADDWAGWHTGADEKLP